MVVDAVIIAFALWASIALRYGEMYKDLTSFGLQQKKRFAY